MKSNDKAFGKREQFRDARKGETSVFENALKTRITFALRFPRRRGIEGEGRNGRFRSTALSIITRRFFFASGRAGSATFFLKGASEVRRRRKRQKIKRLGALRATRRLRKSGELGETETGESGNALKISLDERRSFRYPRWDAR